MASPEQAGRDEAGLARLRPALRGYGGQAALISESAIPYDRRAELHEAGRRRAETENPA